MHTYRLFLLDHEGRFERCDEFACPDDGLAILRAGVMGAGAPLEIWSENRLVARTGPTEAALARAQTALH